MGRTEATTTTTRATAPSSTSGEPIHSGYVLIERDHLANVTRLEHERAGELCYQTSVLHDLVGELRATAETACQQAHVARHEARQRRQVVKCYRYLRRSADRPAVVLPATLPAAAPR